MDTDTFPDEPPELRVTFQPNLYLQRRGWILDQLRRENVTRVLDVGCGAGELLACLCQPAPWLPPPPDPPLPADASPSIYSDPTSSDRPYYPAPNTLPDKIANLHPSHIFGLDISDIDLQCAIVGTAPKPVRHWNESERWEPLEVKIWRGGLESVNEEFVGVECVVATEVVEHLPEDVLPDFAPVLLGVYHPRLLLMTTPNFTFNARFHPPDAPETRIGGYPDPTGRTDRVFRHHDHKFEWTVDEFRQWCESIAEEWGYSVEVAGVGRSVEPDEWDRDDELGYASQVAKFKRMEDDARCAMRRRKAEEVVRGASAKPRHELLKTYEYSQHPQARQPASLQKIGEAVKAKMQSFRRALTRLEELWFEQEIAVMCGGWFEYLVAAVETHDDLEMKRAEGAGRSEWQVELIGGVQDKPDSWWDDPGDDAEQDELEPEDISEYEDMADEKENSSRTDDWDASCGAGETGTAQPRRSEWGESENGWSRWGDIGDSTISSTGWQ